MIAIDRAKSAFDDKFKIIVPNTFLHIYTGHGGNLVTRIRDISYMLQDPVGVPGRGFLPLRKNRLSVFPACRKRRLKGGRLVGIRGGGS